MSIMNLAIESLNRGVYFAHTPDFRTLMPFCETACCAINLRASGSVKVPDQVNRNYLRYSLKLDVRLKGRLVR
jgi:hypothetical protein